MEYAARTADTLICNSEKNRPNIAFIKQWFADIDVSLLYEDCF